MLIGIDVGISTTKIVGIKDGEVISPIRITAVDPVTSLYGAFGKFLYDNGFGLSERQIRELQDIIQETIHKSVEIQEVTVKNDGPSLRDLEIKETLSREIAFPISEEEFPEEW